MTSFVPKNGGYYRVTEKVGGYSKLIQVNACGKYKFLYSILSCGEPTDKEFTGVIQMFEFEEVCIEGS